MGIITATQEFCPACVAMESAGHRVVAIALLAKNWMKRRQPGRLLWSINQCLLRVSLTPGSGDLRQVRIYQQKIDICK